MMRPATSGGRFIANMNTQLPQRPLFTLPIYSLNLHDPIQQVQNTENIVQDPKIKNKKLQQQKKNLSWV